MHVSLIGGGKDALYFELLEKIVKGEDAAWIVDEIDEPVGGLDSGGPFWKYLAVRLFGGDGSVGGLLIWKCDGKACNQGQKALLAGDAALRQVVVAQGIIRYGEFDSMGRLLDVSALEKMSRDEFIGADDGIVAAGEAADGLRHGR